jgi:hypothetical protein
MSNIVWENLFDEIDSTWSYELTGKNPENFFNSIKDTEINNSEIKSKEFKKRKHIEQTPGEYTIEYCHNKYKYN